MLFKAKRAVSCLLTVLMLLTMLPVSTFAVGSDDSNSFNIETDVENIEITQIEEDAAAYSTFVEAAMFRRWGSYFDESDPSVFPIKHGHIFSAYHIESTSENDTQIVNVTMDAPDLVSDVDVGSDYWAVLALVDGELITYPAKEENDKVTFRVRLGETGTDFALSTLTAGTDSKAVANGYYGELTVQQGNVDYNEELGWVRSYTLTYQMADGIIDAFTESGGTATVLGDGLDFVFYLRGEGVKIAAEDIQLGNADNHLVELVQEETGRTPDGQYKITLRMNRDNIENEDTRDYLKEMVAVSYAAPNNEDVLLEGELQVTVKGGDSSDQMWLWGALYGCVPLPLTFMEAPDDGTTYHKITVTQTDGGKIEPRGVEGEVWVKEGENQTFTITPDQGYHIEDVTVDNKSVGPVETYTFNSVTDDSHSITATFAENPAVTITPADLTIYMGGDGGYDAVVGEDGEIEPSTNSLPHPLFKVTMPEDSSVNPATLTFTNGMSGDDEKTWTLVCDNPASDGEKYYHFQEGPDQAQVRVTYTYTDKNGEEHVVTNDTFDPTVIGDVFATCEIAIYPGENNLNTITAKDTDGKEYNVSAGTGTLTVRAVADSDATTDIVDTVPANEISSGQAVAVVPADTTYTLNNTGVKLPTDAKPSLLFDSIIEDGESTVRTDALKARIQTEFGTDTNVYEIKYLDLVDANNGNAWIKASEPVDIYWGYPDGTTQDTKFTVVHFKDLHRDGDQSGYDTADIASCEVETIQAVSTDQGIKFSVQPGQFSPFALVAAQDYTITATAGANGSITPSGEVTVNKGESATFTITPNNGYHIEDVLVDGVSVGAVSTYTFSNVTANHIIHATFERNSLPPVHYYTITATAGEGGAIAPDGTVRVAQGADWTFTISAAEGYVIADVLVDGESIGAVDSYTFENVRQNHTIEARFQPVSDVADPDDTGVSDWLNTDDHLAYLDGYPDNTFQPEEDMTRAEAAQMFYNLLRDQDVDTTVSFTDVAADAWYAEAVNTLATLEIVDGVGDNRFAPERTITRAEFTTMAMRFCQEIPTGENIFSDVDQDDWFYDYVVGSIQYGWISGYPDGTFGPNDPITRAEVTTIANRMLGRSADKTFVDIYAASLRQFTDLADIHWAYYDIMEAANSHNYSKSNRVESWINLKTE